MSIITKGYGTGQLIVTKGYGQSTLPIALREVMRLVSKIHTTLEAASKYVFILR